MDNNKFSNSCIYKISCKDTTITECYVGSTCDFKRRKIDHKSYCNNEKNLSLDNQMNLLKKTYILYF